MDGHGLKILVAEGNAHLAEALGDLLGELNEGTPVIVARTVAETVDLAGREHPDLVLIDHWIGRGPVEATVRQVLEQSPRSSVVVMATRVDEHMVSLMRSAGATDCVEKDDLPASAKSIVDAVRRP